MTKPHLQARRKGRTEEKDWFDAFDFKLPKTDAEKWLKALSNNSDFEYRLVEKGGEKKD